MSRLERSIVVGLLFSFAVGAGCSSKPGESDTDGASSETGETSMMGASNTSAPGTTTDAGGTTSGGGMTGATTGGETTGGEPTSGGTTSVESTGGDPATGYEEACADYCAFIDGCRGAASGCVEDLCQDNIGPGSECVGAWVDAFACFLSLSCAEAINEDNRCMDALFAADDSCSEPPGTCGEGTFGLGPGTCELSEPCPDHARQLFCGEGVCTCFEDDVAVAECADEGVCPNIDKVNAAAMACCGWDLLDNEPG